MLCDDEKTYEALKESKVEPVQAMLWPAGPGHNGIFNHRWGAIHQHLQKVEKDTKVLVTDTKDVIFQRDPFEMMSPGMINVATEGHLGKYNPWVREQTARMPNVLRPTLDNNPVICAGVWGSDAATAAQFSGDVYDLVRDWPSDVEQNGMNAVLQLLYKDKLNAIPYARSWCAHLAQMYKPRGPAGRSEIIPEFRDGQMWSGNNLFAIVHHVWWWKWPELKSLVEAA